MILDLVYISLWLLIRSKIFDIWKIVMTYNQSFLIKLKVLETWICKIFIFLKKCIIFCDVRVLRDSVVYESVKRNLEKLYLIDIMKLRYFLFDCIIIYFWLIVHFIALQMKIFKTNNSRKWTKRCAIESMYNRIAKIITKFLF